MARHDPRLDGRGLVRVHDREASLHVRGAVLLCCVAHGAGRRAAAGPSASDRLRLGSRGSAEADAAEASRDQTAARPKFRQQGHVVKEARRELHAYLLRRPAVSMILLDVEIPSMLSRAGTGRLNDMMNFIQLLRTPATESFTQVIRDESTCSRLFQQLQQCEAIIADWRDTFAAIRSQFPAQCSLCARRDARFMASWSESVRLFLVQKGLVQQVSTTSKAAAMFPLPTASQGAPGSSGAARVRRLKVSVRWLGGSAGLSRSCAGDA